MVVMNIRKFFTELVNPLGYTRLGYIVFFGKATEGSALLKMKTYNLLLEFKLIMLTHCNVPLS